MVQLDAEHDGLHIDTSTMIPHDPDALDTLHTFQDYREFSGSVLERLARRHRVVLETVEATRGARFDPYVQNDLDRGYNALHTRLLNLNRRFTFRQANKEFIVKEHELLKKQCVEEIVEYSRKLASQVERRVVEFQSPEYARLLRHIDMVADDLKMQPKIGARNVLGTAIYDFHQGNNVGLVTSNIAQRGLREALRETADHLPQDVSDFAGTFRHFPLHWFRNEHDLYTPVRSEKESTPEFLSA